MPCIQYASVHCCILWSINNKTSISSYYHTVLATFQLITIQIRALYHKEEQRYCNIVIDDAHTSVTTTGISSPFCSKHVDELKRNFIKVNN